MCSGQAMPGTANVHMNIGISSLLLSHLRNEIKRIIVSGYSSISL